MKSERQSNGGHAEEEEEEEADGDEDGDEDIARAIALSMEEFIRPTARGQGGSGGPEPGPSPSASAARGADAGDGKPKRKRAKVKESVPAAGARVARRDDGHPDVPDGPLIDLFRLISGGDADGTIGVREMTSVVRRNQSLLDVSEFTPANVTAMIVAANAMYGDGVPSGASAVSLETFAALVRGQLPRLFEKDRTKG